MDKSIKKYLTKIIKESFTSDVDEMAFLPSGKRGDNLNKLPQKAKGFPKNPGEYDMVSGSEDEFYPAWWLYNPTLVIDKNSDGIRYVKEPGTEIIIIPTTCRDETEFNQENEEWVHELEEKYGLEIRVHYCNPEKGILKDLPRSGKVGTAYQHSGKFQSEGEKNQRKFNGILRRTIFGEGFNEVLNKKSIPSIKIDRENKDMHEGTYTNEKIVFRTHNNNSYQSSVDFLKAVIARFQGKEGPEMKTYAMARQYNNGNAKWNADRKMDVTYQGKTDIYGLDRRGYEEANLDVTVRMDLEILGERMGESFSWNVRMKVNLGKKLTEDRRMKGSFDNVKLTQTTKTAQLEPGKEFNENNIIMDDLNVTSALIEAIDELKNEITGITLKELLPLANVTYKQTTSMQEPNLNESKERLIRRIVKQIKP
jgi:hypothetical protein